MKAQVTPQNTTGIFELIGSAIKEGMSDKNEISHTPKVTKIYSTTKYLVVERYQREYGVEFGFDDSGELELWSIDGNPDVEDTYSESFIKAITEEVKEKLEENSNTDNDEDYDNHFQNYEVL